MLWVQSPMQTECPLSTSLWAQIIHIGIMNQIPQPCCLHFCNCKDLVPWKFPLWYLWAFLWKPHVWSSNPSTCCRLHWASAHDLLTHPGNCYIYWALTVYIIRTPTEECWLGLGLFPIPRNTTEPSIPSSPYSDPYESIFLALAKVCSKSIFRTLWGNRIYLSHCSLPLTSQVSVHKPCMYFKQSK